MLLYYPKISIITPSYNQSQFLEATIISVIGQQYQNLEYIIIDGGSTDNSIDIIKRYADKITYWESVKDKGQSHAINKGFERATGEIFAWLNSDDLYMPGALNKMAEYYNSDPKKIYYGNCLHFEQKGNEVYALGSDVNKFTWKFLTNANPIIQPSSFWPSSIWQSVGRLREDMHFGFDWEWFLRANDKAIRFQAVREPLSLYRFHESHKTGSGGNKRREEILKIYEMYDKRFAALYKILMQENINTPPYYFRATRKTIELLGIDFLNARILKLYKWSKYKDYSVKEIAGCISML